MAIAQKLIYTTFIALLVATLAHKECVADGRIAASAADVSPVQPGETAPGFTVRTVDDEPYVFDPGRLERPVERHGVVVRRVVRMEEDRR